MATPEIQDLGRPVFPDLSLSDRWQPPERIATWPGNGNLPPRKARPTPLPLLSAKPQPPSPKAKARRAAKEVEQQRTFAGVAPGAVLPPLGQRQQVLARARLSPAYARALRVVAWKLGRKSGRVPLNPQTLAIVEALAARFRAKEDAVRTYPAPNAAQRIKRAVRAVAREPGVVVHRRTWHLPSGRMSAATGECQD